MDVIVLGRESYDGVLVLSPTEYSRINQENEPLPFTFAAVKTEVEVSLACLSTNMEQKV